MSDRVQFRRDTKERWASLNPILMEGEIGLELDTKHQKIGDGEHAWNDLEYTIGVGNVTQEVGSSENLVMSQKAVTERIEVLDGIYRTQSEEFFYCIIDAEEHFLFGIQQDGSIEWSEGIPAPIRAKFQEIISQSQQDKTDFTEALSAAKEEIAALQETKVDKEEGKSLIDDEVKECFKVIENEEYIHAITDGEDRLLFGIKREDGKPHFPQNEMYHIMENEEFFAVWLDAENHVLFGIRRDGYLVGNFTEGQIKTEDFTQDEYPDFFQK